ncbi:hypothetical protein GRI75_11975 [Altererythrobacter soli]|uniref:Lipoprotein n=1 Tax=Croceibacterium soli TaxID=1739690 RepID=A0A6I4UYH8_9SPHN|nr:hypothetical protein [Croceibacterium soli]MXP42357.1 hypothetical protein [Croceibacterium soli]
MFACLVAPCLLLATAAPAIAQEKTGIKEGFVLKPGSARIAMLEPSVRVGEQSTGGMFEPNADWTDQAKENIEQQLRASQANLGNEIVRLDIDTIPEGKELTRYHSLFGAVADSVIEYQFFKGNRLPSKKRSEAFEWSVGTDLRKIEALKGYDYILLVRTKDAYGSTGRKLLQAAGFLAAAFTGFGTVVSSGEHTGMAGLVDIETGDLVWLNADLAMGGDVRTAEGAEKRVGQLLEGFPGAPGAVQ